MYLCINKVIKNMGTTKKYELTDNTINIDGITLHRIKALKDFSNVKAGDLGGWIEKENNLSQMDNAWIGGDAKVYGSAKVCCDANDLFDKNYLEVYVNGEKFEQAACVYDMTENSKQFVCNVDFDNTFSIMFGNEIFGYRIHEGDSIKIRFIKFFHKSILLLYII